MEETREPLNHNVYDTKLYRPLAVATLLANGKSRNRVQLLGQWKNIETASISEKETYKY